jgi:argininosuccinate lyase
VPEKVSIIEDQKIIKVDSFGVIKIEDLRNSMQEVARIHKEQGLNRVFVDATKETEFPSELSAYEFGTEMAESMMDIKIAVITSQKMKNIIRFLETVAQNRGAQLQIFDAEDEALAWLKK